ncbi:unnamed protein product [Medioppia subpectinata]|uniref:Nuclear receptor domain-containing protein n=1 Tax=Medioppia subpectinata TaxID=1979941 RepID=A0A7R9PUQ8_9ACAR|nr:unnamed protein product [Medioppia subpectinata]CAG2101856.1 unnamed protein product [Medioppia subpectinata]
MQSRNFAVITCESCKAFFRRFGLKDKPLNCPSNGNCIINQMTRKLCQKCRLEKCFAVGMKKEFIRSDEENEKRKKTIRENKLKRENSEDLTDSSVSSVYSFTDSSNDLIIFDENKEKDILDELSVNSIDITLDEMTDIENSITDITLDESLVVMTEIADKCENTAIVPMFREITDYNGLNELESNRISELTSAAVVFEYKMSDNIIQINSIEEMLKTCSHKQEFLIMDMANFSKSLSGFNTNDATTVMANMRVFAFGNGKYLELCRPLMHQLVDEWNYDDPIAIDLLTAIIFYNPNRPNIRHKHNVKLEQQLYIYLLQRYLLWKHRSDSESGLKLQKLMLSLKSRSP